MAIRNREELGKRRTKEFLAARQDEVSFHSNIRYTIWKGARHDLGAPNWIGKYFGVIQTEDRVATQLIAHRLLCRTKLGETKKGENWAGTLSTANGPYSLLGIQYMTESTKKYLYCSDQMRQQGHNPLCQQRQLWLVASSISACRTQSVYTRYGLLRDIYTLTNWQQKYTGSWWHVHEPEMPNAQTRFRLPRPSTLTDMIQLPLHWLLHIVIYWRDTQISRKENRPHEHLRNGNLDLCFQRQSICSYWIE